jgi:hypothetical protein
LKINIKVEKLKFETNGKKNSGRISEVENQEFLSRRRLRNFYENPKFKR